VLQRTLDGFRISIYADLSKPHNVLESYTFSFMYGNSIFGAQEQLVGIGLSDSSNNNTTTVGGARSNYDRFMRQLHQYHQSLPDLPSQSQLNAKI